MDSAQVVAVMHSLLSDLRQVASASGQRRFQGALPALRVLLATIDLPRYLPRYACLMLHRGLLSHSESLLPWLSLAPAPVELLLLPSTSLKLATQCRSDSAVSLVMVKLLNSSCLTVAKSWWWSWVLMVHPLVETAWHFPVQTGLHAQKLYVKSCCRPVMWMLPALSLMLDLRGFVLLGSVWRSPPPRKLCTAL